MAHLYTLKLKPVQIRGSLNLNIQYSLFCLCRNSKTGIIEKDQHTSYCCYNLAIEPKKVVVSCDIACHNDPQVQMCNKTEELSYIVDERGDVTTYVGQWSLLALRQ